jgi:hypothetical protein
LQEQTIIKQAGLSVMRNPSNIERRPEMQKEKPRFEAIPNWRISTWNESKKPVLRQIKRVRPRRQRRSLIAAPSSTAIAPSSTVTTASTVAARTVAATPIATCGGMVAQRMANAEPAPKAARGGGAVIAMASSPDVATDVVASTRSFAPRPAPVSSATDQHNQADRPGHAHDQHRHQLRHGLRPFLYFHLFPDTYTSHHITATHRMSPQYDRFVH